MATRGPGRWPSRTAADGVAGLAVGLPRRPPRRRGQGNDAGLVGARVTKVGHLPVAEARAAVEPLVPRDNASSLRANLPMYLLLPEVLTERGVLAPGDPGLTVERLDGSTTELTVEPIPLAAYRDWVFGAWGGEFPEGLPPDEDGPPHLRNHDQAFWSETLRTPAGDLRRLQRRRPNERRAPDQRARDFARDRCRGQPGPAGGDRPPQQRRRRQHHVRAAPRGRGVDRGSRSRARPADHRAVDVLGRGQLRDRPARRAARRRDPAGRRAAGRRAQHLRRRRGRDPAGEQDRRADLGALPRACQGRRSPRDRARPSRPRSPGRTTPPAATRSLRPPSSPEAVLGRRCDALVLRPADAVP